jgi:antitoxin StbD
MTHLILADIIASVSELKKHPMQVINQAKGKPIAILNRNQPVFYCVSPQLFELILDKVEDEELVQLVAARASEREIEANINDL